METKAKIVELKQARAKIITDYRKVLDNAGTRALRAEEKEAGDNYESAIEEHDQRISALEKALDMEDRDDEEKDDTGPEEKQEESNEGERSVKVLNGRRVVEVGNNRAAPQQRDSTTGKLTRHMGESDQEYGNRCRRSAVSYMEAFRHYILSGERGLSRYLGSQKRDVQADLDYNGGFLVMPQMFVSQLIKFTDNLLWIRQLATKFQLANAQSLGAPVLDTDPDDSDWTSELATGNVDSATAFGKRELVPYPLAKRMKASNKLLRMASVSSTFSAYDAESGLGPVENFLMSRLAYKTVVPQEKAFQTGNGVNQPLGIFTASSRGISTGRDVQTGSSTGFTGDGLIAAKYSLKQQYHGTARWLFSRTAIRNIRQLKDSYGQYLWLPGLQQGQPDRLLDLPVMMSEYTPSTFTTGQYVGMLADFSFYWIADSVEYQIQKLTELYAEQNQTGFIVRAELDGMPVLEEAFARLITN